MRALESKSSIHSAIDLHVFQTKGESYVSNDEINLVGDTNNYSIDGGQDFAGM